MLTWSPAAIFIPFQINGHIAKYRGKRCDNDEWLIDSALIYDDELSNHRASIYDCATGEFEEVKTERYRSLRVFTIAMEKKSMSLTS